MSVSFRFQIGDKQLSYFWHVLNGENYAFWFWIFLNSLKVVREVCSYKLFLIFEIAINERFCTSMKIHIVNYNICSAHYIVDARNNGGLIVISFVFLFKIGCNGYYDVWSQNIFCFTAAALVMFVISEFCFRRFVTCSNSGDVADRFCRSRFLNMHWHYAANEINSSTRRAAAANLDLRLILWNLHYTQAFQQP